MGMTPPVALWALCSGTWWSGGMDRAAERSRLPRG